MSHERDPSGKPPWGDDSQGPRRPGFLDAVRQWFKLSSDQELAHPDMEAPGGSHPGGDAAGAHERPRRRSRGRSATVLVAELATCLWYVKTKHFKRAWGDDETADDEPRVRRTLGRLNRAIDALRDAGVEISDPTNERYPPGSENTMRPIQFQPTEGLTYDLVTETVVPIIYVQDHLVQPGEVYVAVPMTDEDEDTAEA